MIDRMLKNYQDELIFLQEEGKRFAQKHPRIAARLQLEADGCQDPHVNRLLQGFALLAARIHCKLEDDYPEICQALLEQISPGYLRPVPSMTIVECKADPSQGRQTAGQQLKRNSELVTKATVDGMPCRFKTVYDVDLWPFSVVEANWTQPERLRRPARSSTGEFAAAAVRILLRCFPDVQFEGLPIQKLRLHLAGGAGAGGGVVFSLYELLADRCFEIQLRDPRQDGKTVPIGASNLKPAGFSPAESLLPFERRSVDGHRLLEEYFALPEKFLFFDLEGLEPLGNSEFGEEVEIIFLIRSFDRQERQQPLEMGVNAATFRLGCTPAINLFKWAAKPIQLSQVKHEYPVEPDLNASHSQFAEIHSIQNVVATHRRLRRFTPIEPFFAYRYQTQKRKELAYWVARRRFDATNEKNPSSIGISVVDLVGSLTEPEADTLDVSLLCTNHNLPSHSKLAWSQASGDFETSGCAAAKTITALSRPTPSLPAPAEESYQWRLISTLSLNYLSVSEGGEQAIKEILRLHNRSDSIACENQIGALEQVKAEPGFALIDSDFGLIAARGIKVAMKFDEQQFAGAGLYLFSAVLDRFLGGYASMNSFSQLTVNAQKEQRKEPVASWLPRSGNKALL